MKILLVILVCVFSFGCEKEYYSNNPSLEELKGLEEVCYKGNRYIRLFQYGRYFSLTPLIHDNGSPVSCEVDGKR